MNTQNKVTPINTKAIREKQFLKYQLEALRLDLMNNYLTHKNIADYPELQKTLQDATRLIENLDIVIDHDLDDEPF